MAIQGHLDLKNVHKQSEIYLPDGGSVNVTGVHGTVKARTYGGHINFQLTELYDDSLIEAEAPESLNVNISEIVESYAYVRASAPQLTVDSTLAHLKDKQDCNGVFEMGDADISDGRLRINSNGVLRIGKLTWFDTLKLGQIFDKKME